MKDQILEEDKIDVDDLVYLEDFAEAAYKIADASIQIKNRQIEKIQFLFDTYRKLLQS